MADILSLKSAALELGCSTSTVRRMVKDKRLEVQPFNGGLRTSGKFFFKREDVQRLKRQTTGH